MYIIDSVSVQIKEVSIFGVRGRRRDTQPVSLFVN
jgi:hypothetical protein